MFAAHEPRPTGRVQTRRSCQAWDLGKLDGAPVTLAAFTDTEEQLAINDQSLAALQRLVDQMDLLYVHPHFGRYTFLLTASDAIRGKRLVVASADPNVSIAACVGSVNKLGNCIGIYIDTKGS